MKNFKRILILVLIVVFLSSYAMLGLDALAVSMPHNAKVYADDSKKVYYSPNYVADHNIKNVRVTTAKEVLDLKYSPDNDCQTNEKYGFAQEGRSTIGKFLEKVNILSKKSRWNDDGSWNW